MTLEEAFAVLGLGLGTPPGALRAAYRRKVKHAHPDGGGSSERFAELNAAYVMALHHADGEPCPACKGQGRTWQPGGSAWIPLYFQCATCNGSGRKWS
jgi:DnaJ-class molecular chaperone